MSKQQGLGPGFRAHVNAPTAPMVTLDEATIEDWQGRIFDVQFGIPPTRGLFTMFVGAADHEAAMAHVLANYPRASIRRCVEFFMKDTPDE